MDTKMFLLTQSGKRLAILEAKDKTTATIRAKGLGNVLDFAPSIPFDLVEQASMDPNVPVFHDEYFKLLGFR